MAGKRMSKDEIKATRESLGLTQTQFAEAIGVNQTTVSLWESGDRSPSGSATILIRQLQRGKKFPKKIPAMAH